MESFWILVRGMSNEYTCKGKNVTKDKNRRNECLIRLIESTLNTLSVD